MAILDRYDLMLQRTHPNRGSEYLGLELSTLHNHQYNINTTKDLTRHLTKKSLYPLHNPYYVLLNSYNNITFEEGLY